MARQNPGSKLKKQDNRKPVKGQSKGELVKERGRSSGDTQSASGLNGALNNMQTPHDKFGEFIRQLAPLMPIYRSIEFACVAARRGREWVLISGEAVLSTEPCAPEAQISPVVKLEDIVALKECIPAERISDLVRNLRDSYVVRNLNGIDVRLTAKGAPDYMWQLPKVVASRSRSNLWGRALALKGCDRDLSSLRSDYNLEKINLDLYASTSPYDGFDKLCRDLGLPARLNNLTSLLKFQVSADLPARVTEIGFAEGTEGIYFNCLGTPDLEVLWSTDEPVVERIPATIWDREPSNMACRAPLRIPHGASGFSVVLSFGELIADYATFDFYSEGDLPWGHEVLEDDEDICEHRKIQELVKGEDELIPREVVQKEPPMPDLATGEAPTGIDKHRKDDGDIAEHRKIQELVKGEARSALTGPQKLTKARFEYLLSTLRSPVRKAIMQDLYDHSGHVSARDVCVHLDTQGKVELPRRWSNGGRYHSFADVYRKDDNLRDKIDKEIHKMRVRLSIWSGQARR